MPSRILRENILSSESVCSLDWNAELFYRRLMSVVDDYGRYEASPKLLRAKCYPLQVDKVREADISRWLAACQTAGLIVLYEVESKKYLEVLKFGQQQRTSSKFPQPLMISNDSKCNHLIANAHLVVVGVVDEGVVGVDKANEVLCLPESLNTDDFKKAWDGWVQYRVERKPAMKPASQVAMLKKLERIGPARAMAAIEHSIANGYQGIYEDKNSNGKSGYVVAPKNPNAFRTEGHAKQCEDLAKRAEACKPNSGSNVGPSADFAENGGVPF